MNRLLLVLLLALWSTPSLADENTSQQIDNDIWEVISQSVANRDIVAMGSAYHPDAVVVNAEKTAPIASTLIRWGEGMQREIETGASANVAFRFSKRMDNTSSAFETGIFNYSSTNSSGEQSSIYVNFESLLVNKDGRWVFLMEHQLGETDKAAWEALQ